MRIVHVVETWAGGIATYVQMLAIRQLELGHEVVLLCDRRKLDGWEANSDLRIIEYRSSRNPLKFWAIARKLHECIREAKADVVHCHSSFPGMYVRMRGHLGVRVLYTPHAWSFLKKDIGYVRRLACGFVERVLAKRCTRIVCMSFDELRAARKHGIPASKIDFIYTGLSGEDFDMRDESAEIDEAASLGKIRVGYFGRLDYQKGFDIVLDALPLLKEHVQVHVFGAAVRGNLKTEPNPRVHYHGWLDAEHTRRAMVDMDVVAVPSRWEGLALVPIEAMRAGKVIVVSNESSLPEQVIHGYNGIILRELTGACLAEQLNELTMDECRRMGENARHVFEDTFHIDRFLKSLMNTYERA
jgi:glycosyltransferase involved in cell wall biosynthesis